MAQVFISYTHAEPDQTFANGLAAFLEANEFSVFVDSKIRLGQDWAEQIDLQLRASAHFIVLLSAGSVASDMVRREISLAYRLKKANRLTIFPVRIAFAGDLPYDVGAYLDLIQYVSWRPEQPPDHVYRTILDALHGSAPTKIPVATQQPSHFEEAQLIRLRDELARYLGPIAPVIVDRAARKAAHWSQLCELVASEIPVGEERKKFMAGCSR
jgi:hypothetical protein